MKKADPLSGIRLLFTITLTPRVDKLGKTVDKAPLLGIEVDRFLGAFPTHPHIWAIEANNQKYDRIWEHDKKAMPTAPISSTKTLGMEWGLQSQRFGDSEAPFPRYSG